MKNPISKIFFRAAYPLVLCLAVIACSKHEIDSSHSDGLIHVTVDAEGSRASVITTTGIKTSPGKFILEAYVDRDVFTDVAGQHADTRVGNAYIESTTKLTENVAFDGSKWNLTKLDSKNNPIPCYWVSSDGNMSFWSRVKSQNGLNNITIDKESSALYLTSPNIDETNGVKMVFDYSLPTPTLETNPSATSLTDASNQEDLLFSYWEDALHPTSVDPDTEEPTYPDHQDVLVHFYHALTQIRFAFSNGDGSFQNNLMIKSVAISDVASGGTCTFWGNLAMNEFTASDAASSDARRDVASLFVWSDLKDSKTYRQDYGITVKTSYSDASEYAGWTKGSYTKEEHTYDLYTCQNVFMMIPQALSSTACVRLTIVDSSKPEGQQEQEFVSYIKPLGATWEAGKYYTYKLNYQNDQITFSCTLVDWGVIGSAREFTVE